MRNTCATCSHYSAPGTWSAYCRHPGGYPDFLRVPKRGEPGWASFDPAGAFVRADNSCGRHSAAAAAVAELRRVA